MYLQTKNIRLQGADLALLAEVARPQEPPALNANSLNKEFAIVGTNATSSTTASLLSLLQETLVHE